MSNKRIPVRVIHTAKDGYAVELFVQAKELNANLSPQQMMRHGTVNGSNSEASGITSRRPGDTETLNLKV